MPRGKYPHPSKPLSVRFWSKVQKTDGCWLWTSSCNSNGYGQISSGRGNLRPLAVHRVSWELHNGPIPEDKWVLHTCDVRNCVRPDHLYLGTVLENNRDIVNRGRHYMLGHGELRAGTNHASAILNWDLVTMIREEHAKGVQVKQLALRLGYSASLIWLVVNNRGWKEIHRPVMAPAESQSHSPLMSPAS